MTTFTNVECTYTGGGVYVVTAMYGDVHFTSDLDLYGTYDASNDVIEENYDCDYDSHWKDPSEPLPSWGDLLSAIMESHENGYSNNMDADEVIKIMLRYHPDLSIRIGDTVPAEADRKRFTVSLPDEDMDMVVGLLQDDIRELCLSGDALLIRSAVVSSYNLYKLHKRRQVSFELTDAQGLLLTQNMFVYCQRMAEAGDNRQYPLFDFAIQLLTPFTGKDEHSF